MHRWTRMSLMVTHKRVQSILSSIAMIAVIGQYILVIIPKLINEINDFPYRVHVKELSMKKKVFALWNDRVILTHCFLITVL